MSLKQMLREHMKLHLDSKVKNHRVMTNAHHTVHVSSCEALLLLFILILSSLCSEGTTCTPKNYLYFHMYSHVISKWSSCLGLR